MRVRCEGCRAEYLLALSCKTRYFCPSCHAKRLACWTQWLGDDLLAPVAHRQMVFVLPKRLPAYFQWRRKLLGDLARIAARTATDFVRATLDEPELSVGMALCIQTHGSLLNWQPHATDALTEAFRRHDLRLFVARELLEPEVAPTARAASDARQPRRLRLRQPTPRRTLRRAAASSQPSPRRPASSPRTSPAPTRAAGPC